MQKLLLLVIILCSNIALSQDKVYFEQLVVPTGIVASKDPDIPKIAWYRWTTKNFNIHVIEKDQGEYLFENIELMKNWCFERWGFESIDFSGECRIFCAPDVATMKKLFNIDRTRVDVKEEAGKIKISYLWLILDEKPAQLIPPSLTIICLRELECVHRFKFGFWVYRGMPILNSTIPQIKNDTYYIEPYLKKDLEIFFSKSLLAMTELEWRKQKPEIRQLYDCEAALFCLLIRKEFGQNHFLQVSHLKSREAIEVLGFSDFNALDSTFRRYATNIIADIKENKAPDNYLQITRKK